MSFTIKKTADAVLIRDQSDRLVLGYQFAKPGDSKLLVESACYFHPVTTPKGLIATDVAPSDHLHHRGIFLAFVEMRGKKNADFWGWGEHAPTMGRKIVNQLVSGLEAGKEASGFDAVNLWQAEGETLIEEDLTCKLHTTGEAHVLNLKYRLLPKMPITLPQWAFSGFCVRLRKEGKLTALSPEGEIKLPNPNHMKPGSDWPDAAWYSCQLDLPEGPITVAVGSARSNPPTLWHNHRDTRMINPCIVAKGKIELEPGKALDLGYTVVVADGHLDSKGVSRFMT